MDNLLKKQLQKWHEDDAYQAIIDTIEAMPEEERDDDLIGQLARAYNNRGQQGDYERAIDLLMSTADRCQDEANWHFRLAYAYYYLDRDAQAMQEFERALELDPEDEDAEEFIRRCRRNLVYPTATKPFTMRVAEFWQAFAEQEEGLREQLANKEDLTPAVRDVQQLLKIAFAESYFEMGFNGEKYELTLTPEGEKDSLFKLQYWQSRAPEALQERWNFYAGRQKVASLENLALKMHEIDMEIAPADVWCWPEVLEGRQVGLVLYADKWQTLLSENENAAYSMAAILLDQCIGEASAIVHIGWLELAAEKPDGAGLPLTDLDDFIHRQVDEREGELDPCSYVTGYELEPADLSGEWDLREDIMVGYTACPEIIHSYYQGDSAIMDAHQADGVVYAFLFYDNQAIDTSEMVPFRGELEDEIAQKAKDYGEIIGGATGQMYSYIDCICYDVGRFVDVAAEVLNSRRQLSERGFHVFRREVGGVNLNPRGLMPDGLKEDIEALAEEGYMGRVIELLQDFIEAGVEAGRFTQEEAEQDMDIALQMAYAHGNFDQYEHYWEAAQWLSRVEDKASGNGTWYYRYSVALMYLGRLQEALAYAERGVLEEPDYPWCWLHLAGLRSHFGNQIGALAAIDAGLALVPGDYEFLRRRQEILAGRSLEEMENHYIDEEADRQLMEGELAEHEQTSDKLASLAGIVCNEAGLAAVKAVLEPDGWEADNPYCWCKVHWYSWTLECVLGLNEAALSKMAPERLVAIKEALPRLDEQALEWLQDASAGRLQKDRLVLKGINIRRDYALSLSYEEFGALDEAVYSVTFKPDLEIDELDQSNYQPEVYTMEEFDAVEAHISRYFGEYDGVMHELVSPDIHVDVCIIEPTEAHNYYTLVTLGAGAHRMRLPEDVQAEQWSRAEFVICLPPDWDIHSADETWYWPIRCLKSTARLAAYEDSWLGPWHTVSNAKGRYADNTDLAGIILLWPQDMPEEANTCVLPSGDEVNFYQIFPLYEEEIQYKLEYGSEALIENMADVDHVLDIHRPNTQLGFVRPNQKTFLIHKEDILPMLTDWEGPEGCLATDRITVDGAPVGYMYREEPDGDYPDSGWRFTAGDETDEYMDDPDNSGIYALNTICNYDPDIIPLLHFPYGTVFYRDSDGNFRRDEVGPQKRGE